MTDRVWFFLWFSNLSSFARCFIQVCWINSDAANVWAQVLFYTFKDLSVTSGLLDLSGRTRRPKWKKKQTKKNVTTTSARKITTWPNTDSISCLPALFTPAPSGGHVAAVLWREYAFCCLVNLCQPSAELKQYLKWGSSALMVPDRSGESGQMLLFFLYFCLLFAS